MPRLTYYANDPASAGVTDPANVFGGHLMTPNPMGFSGGYVNTRWKVGTIAPGSYGKYAFMQAGTEVKTWYDIACPLASMMGCMSWQGPGDIFPEPPGRTTFRSLEPLNGTMSSGTWDLRFTTAAYAGSGWGTGRVGYAAWSAEAPEGDDDGYASALFVDANWNNFHISSGAFQPTMTPRSYYATINVPKTLLFRNEYIFINVFWEISTKSTNTSNSVSMLIPNVRSESSFVTPNFDPILQVSFAGIDNAYFLNNPDSADSKVQADIYELGQGVNVTMGPVQEIQPVTSIENEINIPPSSTPLEFKGFDVDPFFDPTDFAVGYNANETNWCLGEYFI